MNYQEFLQNIKVTIGNQIESTCTVDIKQIQKNNGTTLDGLIITNPKINIAPTIYLNPYYHRYLGGHSMYDIYEDIMSTYKEVMPDKNLDIEFYKHFDTVKNTVTMKLINFDKNIDLLKDIPHVRFHDLAIVFQAQVFQNKEELGTITIHDSHLDAWDITISELYQEALANSPKLCPVEILNINEIMKPPILNTYLDPHMYIITNTRRIYGASCILYDGVLKSLSEQLNSDLILIPSSIHEFLAVPASIGSTYEYVNSMINEVNTNAVLDNEVLSDHAYYYSLAKDKVLCSF